MSQKLPQRKATRLKGYDYSQNGAYFITICTENKKSLFGFIQNQKMKINAAGQMIELWWARISERFPTIENDYFVVMPNHLHGILVIRDDDSTSIIEAVQWYKSITTRKYGDGVQAFNWTRYDKRLWQRSFHDKIIRNEIALNKLREYVLYNPALWEKDLYYEA